MSRIAIFGATSAIAGATARIWASQKHELFLYARDVEKLEAVKRDLEIRGAAKVGTAVADLSIVEDHAGLIERAIDCLGQIDIAFVAYGSLPIQADCESDFATGFNELNINFISAASLCSYFANYFENLGSGTLAVISSVAGDRGRKSNYFYGAAKGGLSIFLAGIRNRLSQKGIKVVTIKPGFVVSPMTKHVPKGPLFSAPEVVAQGIVKAVSNGSDVVYLPWFWRPIMLIIKHIPEFIFKRLSL